MIGSRSLSSITRAGTFAGTLAAALAGPLAGVAHVAYADPQPGSSVKEAGKHFQRGVALYNEADYRAALVEFKRAYDVAPNSAVLYNIGQTYYQLQNYAAALTTLERYLSESGATAPHRPEVEQTLSTLQARVGRVAVTTNVPDCEITIDDELVGKTPLQDPVLVSIGRRKITAMHEGRPPETRFVDVAAGDTVPLAMALGDNTGGAPGGPGTNLPAHESDGHGYITLGWVATAGFGATALVVGATAFYESRQLKDLRGKFPASHQELSDKASLVSTLSVVADLAAVAAVISGGVTFTLSRSRTHEVHVAAMPNGIQVAGTFR